MLRLEEHAIRTGSHDAEVFDHSRKLMYRTLALLLVFLTGLTTTATTSASGAAATLTAALLLAQLC